MCRSVSQHACVVHAGLVPSRGHKRMSSTLELESQMAMGCHLGAAFALNCGAISQPRGPSLLSTAVINTVTKAIRGGKG